MRFAIRGFIEGQVCVGTLRKRHEDIIFVRETGSLLVPLIQVQEYQEHQGYDHKAKWSGHVNLVGDYLYDLIEE